MCLEEERVKSNYGFVSDLLSSTCQNSQRVLGDTSPSQYFDTLYNLVFHDFTSGRQLPPATRLMLGLSIEFVPRPQAPTTHKKPWKHLKDWKTISIEEFIVQGKQMTTLNIKNDMSNQI